MSFLDQLFNPRMSHQSDQLTHITHLLGILLGRQIEMDRNIMASFEENAAAAQAAQAITEGKIDAVAADIKALQDKIAAFPAAGATPEQAASMADIATHAQAIADRISAVDASANPPA